VVHPAVPQYLRYAMRELFNSLLDDIYSGDTKSVISSLFSEYRNEFCRPLPLSVLTRDSTGTNSASLRMTGVGGAAVVSGVLQPLQVHLSLPAHLSADVASNIGYGLLLYVGVPSASASGPGAGITWAGPIGPCHAIHVPAAQTATTTEAIVLGIPAGWGMIADCAVVHPTLFSASHVCAVVVRTNDGLPCTVKQKRAGHELEIVSAWTEDVMDALSACAVDCALEYLPPPSPVVSCTVKRDTPPVTWTIDQRPSLVTAEVAMIQGQLRGIVALPAGMRSVDYRLVLYSSTGGMGWMAAPLHGGADLRLRTVSAAPRSAALTRDCGRLWSPMSPLRLHPAMAAASRL
jgi:hypothetical protein